MTTNDLIQALRTAGIVAAWSLIVVMMLWDEREKQKKKQVNKDPKDDEWFTF